jgi:hypothetical protein
MLSVNRTGLSTSLRLGYPSNDGFAGLVLDANVPTAVIVLGGVIAVSIVWLATRRKPVEQADRIETPTKLAVTRTAPSAN